MFVKRFALFSLIIGLLGAMVIAANADDDLRKGLGKGIRGFGISDTIVEATGLEHDALLEALKSGSTLAELIQTNGADVDTLIATLVAEASAAVNERTQAMLDGLESRISEQVNSSRQRRTIGRGNMSGKIFADSAILEEATGLDQNAMREALNDGSTLAELIEANDGDVDAVAAALATQATELAQKKLQTMLEGLESRISGRLDGSGQRPGFRGFALKGRMYDDSAILEEATGLDSDGLREALISGSTIAELVEARGGEVDALIDSLVAEATAQINQKSQTILDSLESSIGERINDSWEAPDGKRGRRGRRGPGR